MAGESRVPLPDKITSGSGDVAPFHTWNTCKATIPRSARAFEINNDREQ
jgi:hypothetical protein